MKRILYIEDDDIVRSYISEKLKNIFITEVLNAHSGNHGISVIEQNKDLDLIVSDITMEDGTGLEVLEHLETMNLNIPIVFFSSKIDPITQKYKHFLGQVEKTSIDKLIQLIAFHFSK